jgi:uncharacterized protein
MSGRSTSEPRPGAAPASGADRGSAVESGRHEDRGQFAGARKRRKGPYSAAHCDEPPPPDLLKGIHEFNAGEFFDQHETLETLWRATDADVRYLYQGILLVGVGFYHLEKGNWHGAQAKLAAGIEMLAWFAPACQSVDVADLIAGAEPCLARVRDLGPDRLAEFERSLIPQVRLLS